MNRKKRVAKIIKDFEKNEKECMCHSKYMED